jgi:hypothetical protein
MKTKNIFTTIAVGISLLAPALAIDVPPSKLAWHPGAEAIIDKAIAIKVEAQKKSMLMETEGWSAGHSFAKAMDELAAALGKTPEMRATLEKEEGNDLRAKIALWALDRQARAEEYARIEHVHITDNSLGAAAEKRRVDALRPPTSLPGVTIVKTPSRFKPPPPVADEDAVEQNRLMIEYFYFAPPRGPGRWNIGSFRFRFGEALGKIRNQNSLVMLKFDLENQAQAFPDIKPKDPGAGYIGAEIREVLNFGSISAFRIVASLANHPVMRAHLDLHMQAYQGWIYDAEHARLKAELEAMKRLAEMEWQTDAEKELAGWIKAIPPIPERKE